MALNSLSKELNRTGYGYRMTTGHGETAKHQLVEGLLMLTRKGCSIVEHVGRGGVVSNNVERGLYSARIRVTTVLLFV